MSLQTWWLFVVMTFVVSATPGPNMLLVMSTSARSGMAIAVRTMAGCMAALLAMMSVSALGLGAVLHAFPTVFDALRLLGAAYLAYLGIKTWRSPVMDQEPPTAAEENAMAAATMATTAPGSATVTTPAKIPARAVDAAPVRQGFLVAASNPKAILFAAAFFPQFLQADLPQWPQFSILLLTFAIIEVAWYFIYALSGQRLARYLQRPRVLRVFNRATGAVFVGFAGLMAINR